MEYYGMLKRLIEEVYEANCWHEPSDEPGNN